MTMNMSNERKNLIYAAFAVVVAGVFAALTFGHTTSNPIQKDGAQNIRAAYYLVHTGVMAGDKAETETPRPQMRREPLPIVVIAGFLLLHPAFSQPYTFAELLNGRLTETVKGVNAFWRFLVAIFLFHALSRALFRPPCRSRHGAHLSRLQRVLFPFQTRHRRSDVYGAARDGPDAARLMVRRQIRARQDHGARVMARRGSGPACSLQDRVSLHWSGLHFSAARH